MGALIPAGSRRRVTGLGAKPAQSESAISPADWKEAFQQSVVAGEPASATPTVADKPLTITSRNYLNRETGHAFAFSTSPAGVKNLSISQSGETKAAGRVGVLEASSLPEIRTKKLKKVAIINVI